jgi:hypothetical protein
VAEGHIAPHEESNPYCPRALKPFCFKSYNMEVVGERGDQQWACLAVCPDGFDDDNRVPTENELVCEYQFKGGNCVLMNTIQLCSPVCRLETSQEVPLGSCSCQCMPADTTVLLYRCPTTVTGVELGWLTALHCIALHCTALHCTALYLVLLHNMASVAGLSCRPTKSWAVGPPAPMMFC